MRASFWLIIFLFSSNIYSQDLPEWAKNRLEQQENIFQLNHNYNPHFFIADFDGDGKSDIAIAVNNKLRQNKSGILFYLRNGFYFLAGGAINFGNAGDDFSWVDEWNVFGDETTYRTTFKENGDIEGEESIYLKNPAISIRQNEGSGGLIYYNGEKFIWIHQGG